MLAPYLLFLFMLQFFSFWFLSRLIAFILVLRNCAVRSWRMRFKLFWIKHFVATVAPSENIAHYIFSQKALQWLPTQWIFSHGKHKTLSFDVWQLTQFHSHNSNNKTIKQKHDTTSWKRVGYITFISAFTVFVKITTRTFAFDALELQLLTACQISLLLNSIC